MKQLINYTIGHLGKIWPRMCVGSGLGRANDSHGVYTHFAHQASRFGDLYVSTYFDNFCLTNAIGPRVGGTYLFDVSIVLPVKSASGAC